MADLRAVRRALRTHGLLLKQDRGLPNVVTLVTGQSLRTSWWAHPRARAIFETLAALAAHEDIVVVKLVAGKDTFVHRRLWPAILAVGRAREPWQLARLSPGARRLLREVGRRGAAQSHGPAARQLLARLLVHGTDVHTAAGHHAFALESWERWARRARSRRAIVPDEARAALETALASLGGEPALLPWHRA